MKKYITRTFIFASFILGFTNVHAADPCSLLDDIQARLESREGFLKTVSVITGRIHELLTSPYYSDLHDVEQGVYFTRKTGFYFTLDCSNPNEKQRVVKMGLFGVGDRFKPLKKRIFSGETYFYGITRSGLMALVRKDDLRKFQPGVTYLFNRGDDSINFCTNENNCEGKNKEFNPRFHYAALSTLDFDNTIASAGFRKLVELNSCGPLDVKIYIGAKGTDVKTGKLEHEYQTAELHYCPQYKDNGVYKANLQETWDMFDNLAITGQFVILSSQKLREIIPFMFSQKKCGSNRTVKKRGVYTLGGSVNAGLNFKFIKAEGGGGAKVEYELSEEEIFDTDKQYLYLNYTINPNKHFLVQEKSKMLNDIAIMQNCRGKSIPEELNEVRINVLPEQEKVISIKIKELDRLARERLKRQWAEASASSKLKGRAWKIRGYLQKEKWRQFISGQINDDLPGVLPDDIDPVVWRDYTRFFTALFMASSFEYVPRDTVSRGDNQHDF